MQLNKVLRGLLIALPVATMVACSSGPSEEELEAQRNAAAQQQAEADARAKAEEEKRVQAAAAAERRKFEEQQQEELASLQNEQTVYFDFDRATVSSEYYSLLDKHAAYLVKNPSQSIVIEGHCDSRGTPEYNIALGERRAQAVETYLQNSGVSASQISVVSYGEEKPVAFGSSESDFAQNRRGVLVYQ